MGLNFQNYKQINLPSSQSGSKKLSLDDKFYGKVKHAKNE